LNLLSELEKISIIYYIYIALGLPLKSK